MSPEVNQISEVMPHDFSRAELWLNNAANHAGKLVTLLALADARDILCKGELTRHVGELSGGVPPFADASIFSWVYTLKKTGGVRIGETVAEMGTYSRAARGAEITNEGLEFGVAWAGQLLDWQCRYPDLSLRRVLGSTSTPKDGVYSPTLRMLMYADLVERDDDPDGPSIGSLAAASPAMFNARQQTVETLQREGIVTLHSQQRDNRRQFRIDQPTYQKTHLRAKSFEGLKAQTQLTFKAFEKAYRIKDVWGVDEFMDLVTEVAENSEAIDLVKIRTSIQQGLAPSAKAFKGYISPVKDGQVYEKRSIVKLVEDAKQPIAQLVRIVDGLAGEDPVVVKEGHKKAQQIVTDSDMMGFLISGAHEDSSYVHKEANKRTRHILTILQENPELTSAEITETYREESSRKVGIRAVGSSIRDASALGMIDVSQKVTHPYKSKKLQIHSSTELHR